MSITYRVHQAASFYRYFRTSPLAAPAYHLFSGESTSLYKHMSFALFFAAPVAGTTVGVVAKRVSAWWSTQLVPQLAGAIGCVALLLALLAHIVTVSIDSAQS